MLVALAAITATAFAYIVLLLAGSRWIVGLLYRQGYYESFLWLLPFVSAASFIASVVLGLAIWLKALERPDATFWSQATGAALTLSVGLVLVWAFKLPGAAVALVLVRIAMCAVVLFFLGRYFRHGR
jgi:O-antigen/teichoic acid export membrane protein